MVQPVRQRFEFAQYVQLEETSTVKHEFLDGMVWAMVGGSPDHARITANVARTLGEALTGRPCAVYSSDLRVRVRDTGLATYPDVTVVCDGLETDDDDPRGHTVVNPKLVVEVLSPSTEDYDRGEKLSSYQSIPSLDHVVLVAQDEPRIDVWTRTSGGWVETTHRKGAAPLAALKCSIAVDRVYHDPLAADA